MNADLTLNNICAQSEDIVAFRISGKMILVPLKSGIADFEKQICTLNETGWATWQKLDGVRTLRQVTEKLADNFSSTGNEIEEDILRFITEMLRCGVCILLNCVELINHGDDGKDKKDVDKAAIGLLSQDQLPEDAPSSHLKFGDLSNPEQLELLSRLKESGLSLRTSICGSSMYPFIRNQDLLNINLLNNHPLRIGQVVAFNHWQCENLVIHRIIRKSGSGWVTKGDNRLESDGEVPLDNIIGLVTNVERNGKKVRFCIGMESKIIALLNRGKGLMVLKKLLRIPHRAYSSIFNKG